MEKKILLYAISISVLFRKPLPLKDYISLMTLAAEG
jgi:hypothetical protein